MFFYTSPSLLLLVSVAMHSIPTVPTGEISAISGEFDPLMLFLFTVPSSLRNQTEFGEQKNTLFWMSCY